MDLWLLFLILALFVFGSFMVFSASYAYAQTRFGDHYYFAKRQILWGAIGIPAMIAVSRISPERIRRATPYLFVGILLLLLCFGFFAACNNRFDFSSSCTNFYF